MGAALSPCPFFNGTQEWGSFGVPVGNRFRNLGTVLALGNLAFRYLEQHLLCELDGYLV